MTKPGSTNSVQLSPEGAALVNAVAKRAGLPAGTLAANARVSSRHELSDRERQEKPTEPAGPLFLIDNGVLNQAPGASFEGLRIGMSVLYSNGVASKWTMVIRRDGLRLCEIDYADEETCEIEMASARQMMGAQMITDIWSFSFPTHAVAIRNFDPSNGQEI